MNHRRLLCGVLWLLFLGFFQTCTPFVLPEVFLDSPENLRIYRQLRIAAFNIFGRTSTYAKSLNEAKRSNITQKRIPDDVPFPCNVTGWRSPVPPTSVHRLKAGDIDIIASMGDSLSAGTAMLGSNLFHLLVDNRGVTSAGGGQGTWREYLTLPNILKLFNPNLYGYATGDFSTLEEGSKFNVAEATAESKDMPYMASVLIKRFKNDPKVDMEKHWKYISLMIGANDFCSEMCYVPSANKFLMDHERDIIETLRLLRDNVPRAFVSLIPPPNLKVLVAARESRPSFYCDVMTDFECSCMFGLKYRKKRPVYYDIMERWQMIDLKISLNEEFQREDFAVVVQPVLLNVTFPLSEDGFTDMTYFAPDCFHITQKVNSIYSESLWNSLQLPLEKKPINLLREYGRILCPNKNRPYLSTYANTGLQENSKFDVT